MVNSEKYRFYSMKKVCRPEAKNKVLVEILTKEIS